VMDLKTPGSGCREGNLAENFDLLKSSDEIKFVLTGRKDYLWAKSMIKRHRLAKRFPVILSSAFEALKPSLLARWMLQDHIAARLGLQIHKYIFGAEAKRV